MQLFNEISFGSIKKFTCHSPKVGHAVVVRLNTAGETATNKLDDVVTDLFTFVYFSELIYL